MYKKTSLLQNKWFLKNIDERKALYISQKFNFSIFLSRLIAAINIEIEEIEEFIYPKTFNYIPNPFNLIDMDKSVSRTIEAINNKEKIGILADYDVDGSTSAAILYNFFKFINIEAYIKIPDRLLEGYGPNERIMDEFLKEKITLLYTLDCGTTSFNTLNKQKYSILDIIVIDHHISEVKFPKVHSLVNPNRIDERSEFKDLAAVGITFLFLMALRKNLRKQNFFLNKKEPNLLLFLDLVALGTVCDVVSLKKINRTFVAKGLDVIKSRNSKAITSILDNSNLKTTPKSLDLGYIIGPQINAASRIGDSNLPSKLLISKNINEIDQISSKLNLLNEKRKLIENNIYNQALNQINKNDDSKFILIQEENWHKGVLGIVASRLLNQFFKPIILISFENNIGTGSARSINSINLGNIIMEAKNEGLLISGGGHSFAAGLKIEKNKYELFFNFLKNALENYQPDLFDKKIFFNDKLSINEIHKSLIKDLNYLEPFGKDNEEPLFIFTNIKIESVKIIKEKHILVLFQNDFGKKIKGICFNSLDTIIGDYLKKFNQYNFEVAGILKENNYNNNIEPEIIIKDLMLLN